MDNNYYELGRGNTLLSRKVHIKDSSKLVKCGLIELSKDNAREYFKNISDSNLVYALDYFIYNSSNDNEEINLDNDNPSSQTYENNTIIKNNPIALCLIKRQPNQLFKAHLELRIASEYQNNEDVVSLIAKDILSRCFVDLLLHKVDICFSSRDSVLESVFVKFGAIQEAILHDEYYDEVNACYYDGALYYLTILDYTEFNVVFVPFARGVAAISGTREYVTSVKLYRYETMLDDDRLISYAKAYGIIDGNNCFYPCINKCYLGFNYDFDGEVYKAAIQMKEYFAKTRKEFDIKYSLPEGLTDFQKAVLCQINKVEYGLTSSYSDIARALNDPHKSRAVGKVCSSNPLPIIIPCHRIVGSDGKLTGFSSGVEIKNYLLGIEMFSARL